MQRLVLALSALFLRILAGAASGDGKTVPPSPIAWVLVAVSLWVAVAAAGAWTAAIWIVPAAIVGFFAERLLGRERVVRPVVEVVFATIFARLSVPSLGLPSTALVAVSFAAIGAAIDRFVPRIPPRPRRAAVTAAGVLAILAVGAAFVGARRETVSLASIAPGLALDVPPGGERIDLANGAVAWFDAAPSSESGPAALLFHGNHPAGARQKAAGALRRAFRGAGFRVLALDHPGYGESPCPRADAELSAWDPTPSVVAAFDWLTARGDVTEVVAAGHSLGCDDVIRLLASGRRPVRAMIFGAGLAEDASRDPYWCERFSRARGLKPALTVDRFRAIRDAYYDIGRLVTQLPPDHPEIICVFFGTEHANIEETRQELFGRIPGAKSIWRLPDSTHYFSTYQIAGFVVGDARVTGRLAARLAGLLAVGS